MNLQSPHSQHGRGPRAQPAPPKTPAPSSSTDPHAFDDQARRKTARAKAPARSPRDREIAWVRAGDLPSLFARRVLVRGVDLHAALVRRAMRRPTAAAKNAAGVAKRALTPGGRQQERTEPQQGTEGMGI
ncbi:hypothetical protein [Promicromonospora iranensis]|uniref:Uncharacterized protein n=1 Tax=Promicromonospora iranensis TaxID=1105144 RepID=A0ABU2CIR9_9MICO|nr:hypothetical protein [Promicromonospora iranensis]MDR7381236.1 hypothetical protein [Promicromonospora iranensis]